MLRLAEELSFCVSLTFFRFHWTPQGKWCLPRLTITPKKQNKKKKNVWRLVLPSLLSVCTGAPSLSFHFSPQIFFRKCGTQDICMFHSVAMTWIFKMTGWCLFAGLHLSLLCHPWRKKMRSLMTQRSAWMPVSANYFIKDGKEDTVTVN